MRVAVVAILAGGCFGATTTPPRATAPWGTPAPYDLIATDPAGARARADTDLDGAVATYWGMHGDSNGDKMSAFVVDAGGRETPIDDLLARDDTGRWLAVTIAKAPVLIDTRTWRRTPIRGELPHFDLGKGMRRWSGASERLAGRPIAIRDDGAMLVDGGQPTKVPPELADLRATLVGAAITQCIRAL